MKKLPGRILYMGRALFDESTALSGGVYLGYGALTSNTDQYYSNTGEWLLQANVQFTIDSLNHAHVMALFRSRSPLHWWKQSKNKSCMKFELDD